MNHVDEEIISQEELSEIAENSSLSSDRLMAALLEACGAKPKEISKKLGKSEQYVYQLRKVSEEYVRTVKQFYSIIARRIVDSVSDVDELFNRQIGPSAATLIEVRDNIWAKDSDRIKASLAFLDRASRAPKATQQVENRSLVISLPVSTAKEMKEALLEDGTSASTECLELMEGLSVEKKEVAEEVIELEEGEINVRKF